MLQFTPDLFEERILSTLDLSYSSDTTPDPKAIFFLGGEIPSLFGDYLESIRKISRAEMTNRPLVYQLVNYILAFYMDKEGSLIESRYAYTELMRYVTKILEKFTKLELFTIIFNIESTSLDNLNDELKKHLLIDGKFISKFPLFMTSFIMEKEELFEIIASAEYSVDECEDIESWISMHAYLPLLISKEKIKAGLTEIMQQQKNSEHGFLSDLEHACRDLSSVFSCEHLYQNKIDGKNLVEAAVELLVELGLDNALELDCNQFWEDEDKGCPKQTQNFKSISMLLSTLLSVRKKEEVIEIDDKFITDLAHFIINQSTQSSEKTLIESTYLSPIVKKIASILDDYEGSPIHFGTRFINSYITERGNADLLMDSEKFIVHWGDDIDGWEYFIDNRTHLRLNEKHPLKEALDPEDFFKLVLFFGIDKVESDSFAEFCNNNKSKIFVTYRDGRFSHFKNLLPDGIEFLSQNYLSSAG